jgi:hypothetical protein
MKYGDAKRARVSTSATVGAPTGGLNALNSLADMPPTDAVILDNWFPRTTDVVTRNGYVAWSTGLTGSVETLIAYRYGAVNQLFGIASGSLRNCTTQGASTSTSITGLTNSRWQYVNFGTPGGHFVYAVNAADYPLLYDGTTWLQVGNGTGAAIASITFVTSTATVTTSTPHGLVNGSTVTVTVSGAAPAPYNVTAVPINVLSPTQFTYTMGSTPASNATTVGSFTYTPSIQGVDPRTLRNCDAINSRMWFVENNSLRAWYLPLNSISGTASSIDLSSLAKLGGYLSAVFGFSMASAYGMQNYTIFITSEGEVFSYIGYDPTNAATWSLAARGRIGAPVGDRFWTRLGTDVGIISRDGVIPLSKALQIDRMADNDAMSYKIVNAVNNDVQAYKSNFGWQMQLFPLSNMLIVNVPAVPDLQAYQYVMNTITNAWCRYVGINANCWEIMSDTLFFGANDGTVYQAETGSNDNGAPIVAVAKQAFSYFKQPGAQKRFTGSRPVFTAAGGASITFDMNIDFEDKPSSSVPSYQVPNGVIYWPFPWGSAWAAPSITTKTMQFASGIGYAAAAKVTVSCKYAPVSWQATTYFYEAGGPI